ncbi:CRISPR-associated ring nuclease Csm6 [Oceanobacter sp. 3_MG-2023]|uniref:CRISPR-associated ring nuclease Csm6 n=1 Tax=Oceanobacter sp. 3_MG-2023 TaxID=3062622 RepID=UPI002732AB6C|nr:CRISPR-associated ring nuclease Csm6 [Oceanobacter sp. 3_MG-2023]MDP2505802.1 CRISPR-associated ring nuclease Csm6 [Oceanobacter sp. 3_MG-2023]
MKQLLLAVTGMSPQVITETLYALHHQHNQWPDELCLITTAKGRDRVWQGLITDGHLQALAQQLGRPCIPLTAEQIQVVPNAHGTPVDDARSLEDHEALADFITHTVRNRTADPELAIHASIAGGRKTMTFYLGYAMSLFGRPQDQLSHVLVSEAYEGRADFYYPTATPQPLAQRNGDTNPLDASLAQVTLADIPFVRQRTQINDLLQSGESEGLSYRQLTRMINLGDSPGNLRLDIDETQANIRLIDASRNSQVLQLSLGHNLLRYAFYLMIIDATREQENDLTRPTGDNQQEQQKEQALLGKQLLQRLYRLLPHPKTLRLDTLHRDSCETLATRLLEDDFYLPLLNKQLPVKTLESLQKHQGLTAGQFDNLLDRLKRQFTTRLPANLCQALIPAPIAGIGIDSSVDNSHTNSRKKHHKKAGYQLRLKPEQIHYIHQDTTS